MLVAQIIVLVLNKRVGSIFCSPFIGENKCMFVEKFQILLGEKMQVGGIFFANK